MISRGVRGDCTNEGRKVDHMGKERRQRGGDTSGNLICTII